MLKIGDEILRDSEIFNIMVINQKHEYCEAFQIKKIKNSFIPLYRTEILSIELAEELAEELKIEK